MASKHASRALRASLRQASNPRIQQRTFVSAVNASRPTVQKLAPASFVQQSRGAKTVDFAGDKEKVYGKSVLLSRSGGQQADLDRRARGLAQGQAPCKSWAWDPDEWQCMLIVTQDYFKNDTLALIGYGSQGHGQGLNLRDNGLNVIIGVRKDGASWKEAQQDGWIPGTNLFEVDEAISRGSIIMNLLSDSAQSTTWDRIKPQLTKGKVRFQ